MTDFEPNDLHEEEANDDLRTRISPDSVQMLASEEGIAAAAVSAPVQLRTINRAMIKAGQADVSVGNCLVQIGVGQHEARGTTNANGLLSLDLSAFPDGGHPILVKAPVTSEETPGPGFPSQAADRIYRPLETGIEIRGGRIVGSADNTVAIENGRARISLLPLWMRTPNTSSRSDQPDTIIIHHTGTMDLRSVITTFMSGATSAHYVVGSDGAVYKLADEARVTWHAGYSEWESRSGLNEYSIGIEILHDTEAGAYPNEQIDAVVLLVRQLCDAFPTIAPSRIIGHSDIAINRPEDRPPTRHGRKSTDPGSAFPWESLEDLGLGLLPRAGTVDLAMYAGIFQQDPNRKLRQGESGPAVSELQRDLSQAGYHCPSDGEFGTITFWALKMFQQHIFSGTRLRGDDGQWNSGDGRLDHETATMLKRVIGEIEPLIG